MTNAADLLEIVGEGPLARAFRAQTAAADFPWPDRRVLVIDHGDDLETLATLRQRRGDDARIFAQIGDATLRRAVQSRLEADAAGPAPTLIGVAALEAEHFASQFRPDRMAWMRGQPGVHLAIVGFGPSGEALFDALAASGLAVGLQRPRVLLVTPDAAEARARIAEMAPEIGLSLDLEIVDCAPRDLGDPERSPLASAEAAAPLIAIFVAEETPRATFATCLAICDLQDRGQRATAALFVGGAARDLACDMVAPLRPPRHLGRTITAIAGLDQIPLADYLFDRRERAARRLHESYREAFGGPAVADWDRLGETFRRANRRAVTHVAQKLAALGLDACQDGRVDPGAYAAIVRPIVEARFEDAPVRELARLEHERWSLDRRLDGWSYGPVRSDARRRHPSLVGFDDPRLSAREIEKDISQVRFILGALVEPSEGGALARIVVGAVESNDTTGLTLAEALDLLGQQPWREPTILSPLATPREIDAVSDFVAALSLRSRVWRLIVLERPPAETQPMDAAVAARRAALLTHACSFIAPIATAAPELAADWIDEPHPRAEAVADLIRTRSDIVLRCAKFAP